MKFIVSADDLGASHGVNETIFEAADKGYLTSTSVLAGFEEAMDGLGARPGLRAGLHLNLIEGHPLSPPEAIGLLVDGDGILNRSYPSLLAASFTAPARRAQLQQQIELEFTAQMERFLSRLDPARRDAGIGVDSHMHYHMIPVVFDAVMNLHAKFGLSYVRNLQEPLFRLGGRISPRHHLGINLIKNLLLRGLSPRACRQLDAAGIRRCDHLVGLLFTDEMTVEVVRSAMERLAAVGKPDDVVEILLHPGGSRDDEAGLWPQAHFRDYYASPRRAAERSVVTSPAFRALFT